MAKYDALRDHLVENGDVQVTMSFDQIARLVGGLPKSASTYQPWWANEDPRVTRHVQSKGWGNAGYSAWPDLERQRVVFKRTT